MDYDYSVGRSHAGVAVIFTLNFLINQQYKKNARNLNTLTVRKYKINM